MTCSRTRHRPRSAPARQPLTVLFCDLADFTGLSERLDPEQLHRVVSLYHGLCARIVARHGGQVRQYLGDGVLAYFGHDQEALSQAAAARRAVAAGLAITAALPGLSRRLALTLTVRVGIHSGPVVLGTTGGGGHREVLAVGQVPNVAARLQALAGANQVVVSETVRELVGDGFRGECLGPRQLKGFSRPLTVHCLQRPACHARPAVVWPLPAPVQVRPLAVTAVIAAVTDRERWQRLPVPIGPPPDQLRRSRSLTAIGVGKNSITA